MQPYIPHGSDSAVREQSTGIVLAPPQIKMLLKIDRCRELLWRIVDDKGSNTSMSRGGRKLWFDPELHGGVWRLRRGPRGKAVAAVIGYTSVV